MFLDGFYIKQYPYGEKSEHYNQLKESNYPRSWASLESGLGI